MNNFFIGLVLFLGCAFTDYSNKVIVDELKSIVNIDSGVILGSHNDDVLTFKGIPYAAPPVGEYRWRPPQPISPWRDTLDATTYGANCAQAGWPRGDASKIADGSSEDCLFLNLWLPKNVSTEAKLPVMVWIHGGGFVGGSGSGAGTEGIQFAKQGVILMTFNYRLGRLGHFAFPALSDEHPDEHKGSYAYMDQIAALQWVQDNIEAFGGDPDNVTIFGFSAGGVSVHSLLTIPSAKGLFHKAISQSGGGRDGVLTGTPIHQNNIDPLYPISAETIGINFAKKHGIDAVDDTAMAKLRGLSIEEVVDGGQENDGEGGPRIYSGPILDGSLVVKTAESAYNGGRFHNVPLIIGSNSAEIGGGFVNNSSSKQELFALFRGLSNEAQAAYDPEDDKEFSEVITKFNTDWVWGEPGRMTASVFSSHDQPAYLYQFAYVSEGQRERMRYGAGHGSEVSYVFNNLNARWGAPVSTPEDIEVGKIMNRYWANFAKTGNPNGEDLPHWPTFDSNSNQILEFEREGNILEKIDPRKARFDVIEKAFKNRTALQTRGGI